MKKVILICAGVLIIAAIAISCKKEYTCECLYKDSDGTVMPEYTYTFTFEASKGDAKTACNTSTSVPGMSVTCELK